jgi:short-subunit dehydrogenase
MKDLHGTVVVITGASSGAGRAIANEFSSTGATLILAARREKALEEVAAECRSSGATVYSLITDVRNSSDVANLARFAAEITGKIDIWINNAGVLAAGKLEDIPEEVNRNVILTNLVGYMNGAQQVLPYFKKQGYGLLFNNISVGGWFPAPYAAAYTASKFGIRGFSEALKGELTEFPDIHVIDLYPGFLDTPGMQHAANYTGKVIMPAPPVYDPQKVAAAILKIVHKPVSRKTIGVASALLRCSYATLPALTRNITSMFIRTYLRRAESIDHTSGNVLDPVEFGTGVYGGWISRFKPRSRNVALAAASLVGIGLLLASLRSARD